ncbi:MAG: sigma-70 family RNA polymerase sigma factor [Planctomycetota bacterium]|nr:sigma-70 family RNA polymerase sigma factor [Planctomycetota bacterium]
MSLLSCVRAQEDEAWRRMVRVYSALVHRWCKNVFELQAADIQDVAQDVFVSVAGAIHGFKPGTAKGSFRKWLKVITLNKVRDRLRRDGRQPLGIGGNHSLADIEHSISRIPDESDEAENVLVLRLVLEEIRSEFREATWSAFWMSVMDGLDTDVIAERLGITTHAVRQSCYRVRRRLREELNELVDDVNS